MGNWNSSFNLFTQKLVNTETDVWMFQIFPSTTSRGSMFWKTVTTPETHNIMIYNSAVLSLNYPAVKDVTSWSEQEAPTSSFKRLVSISATRYIKSAKYLLCPPNLTRSHSISHYTSSVGGPTHLQWCFFNVRKLSTCDTISIIVGFHWMSATLIITLEMKEGHFISVKIFWSFSFSLFFNRYPFGHFFANCPKYSCSSHPLLAPRSYKLFSVTFFKHPQQKTILLQLWFHQCPPSSSLPDMVKWFPSLC